MRNKIIDICAWIMDKPIKFVLKKIGYGLDYTITIQDFSWIKPSTPKGREKERV